MPFDPIQPDDLPVPVPPYSPGVRAGSALYVSGQLPRDDAGRIVHPGNIRLQAKYVIGRIEKVVAAAGGTLADVAMVTVVLRFHGNRAAFDEEYAEHFPDAKPARICLYGELTHPEALVEIAAVAHI